MTRPPQRPGPCGPSRPSRPSGLLLLVAGLVATLVGACSSGGDESAAAPSTTTVAAATSIPVVDDTGVAGSTISTEAGASVDSIGAPDPASAAKALYAAWQAGDHDVALLVGEPDVVEQLLAIPFAPWQFQACAAALAPGVTTCTFTSEAGPITMTVAATTSISPKVVVLDLPAD